jgi:hypothetical protein
LAAILGWTVDEVRPLMTDIERRQYVNPTHMKAALDRAGVRYRSIGAHRPTYGLMFVQWSGHEHQPINVQYRFTHWLAITGERVFEVNAPELVSWDEWQRVMPRMMQEAGKGDGGVRIRSGIEVLTK